MLQGLLGLLGKGGAEGAAATGTGLGTAGLGVGEALTADSLMGRTGGLASGLAGLTAAASTLGPTIGAASALNIPPLWQKGLSGILSGRGVLPGMGFGLSDLASKGLGKIGMTGASNFLAENPVSVKVPLWGGGQPNVPPPIVPNRPNRNQQIIGDELNEMINKKLDEFVKQMRMSR